MRKTKSGSYINDMVWWFSNQIGCLQRKTNPVVPPVTRRTSLKFLSADSQLGLKRHLMLPGKFLDDSPRFLGAFVVLDVDDFVSGVGFERRNRLSVSKHQVSRAKSEALLHDVSKVRGDGVGRWQDEVSY